MKLSAVAFVLAVLLQAAFAQSTVNLVVLPSNIQYQEKPILSATVSPAATGVVTGYIDGVSVGTCQTTAASGTCNISATTQVLTVGNHQALVSYTPTAGATTNSSVVTFQVFATTILITTSNPSGPNVPAGVVTFTVSTQNVPSNIGGPSGTITFIDASHGGAVVGSCVITGVATCSANATLSPGTNYTVFAQYPGDSTFDQAFSPSIFLVVGAATTGSTASVSTATSTTATLSTATVSTAASTTANTTTATLTSSTSTTAASSTTTASSTTSTASTSTTAASSTTTTASTATTAATATLTSGSTTSATPTPVPTVTGGTTNPTGPTTNQITTTTTSNNTHPTAAPTKAPTSTAAWTLPSMVFSAVLIALACL